MAGSVLLFVLAGTMLVDAIEVSAMVIAAPVVAEETGLSQAHWLVTGFALGFGALLLLSGRVVWLLGWRRAYLTALTVFALVSATAYFVTDPAGLVVVRVIKGATAALTAPTGLAIIAATYPEGVARDRAMSVYTLCGGAGFSLGLLLSGTLTAVDWRWALAFPAPVVVVLAMLGARTLPAGGPPRAGFDPVGALALAGALTALAFVASEGWPLVAAGVLLGAFMLFERPDPLVGKALLRDRRLVRAAVTAAMMNGVNVGLLLLLSTRLQYDVSPWSTALALLPAALPLAVLAPVAGRLVHRFGARRLVAAGSLAPVAGCAWLLRPGALGDYRTGVLPALLLVALGFVLAFAALNGIAMSAGGPRRRAMAGGFYQTAVQTGAVVVPAVAAGPGGVGALTAFGALGALVGLAGLRDREGTRHSRP